MAFDTSPDHTRQRDKKELIQNNQNITKKYLICRLAVFPFCYLAIPLIYLAAHTT